MIFFYSWQRFTVNWQCDSVLTFIFSGPGFAMAGNDTCSLVYRGGEFRLIFKLVTV